MRLYGQNLIDSNVVKPEEYEDEIKHYDEIISNCYELGKKINQMTNADWLDSPWESFFVEGGADRMKPEPTGIVEENINHILAKFSSISVENFTPHNGIKRILKVDQTGYHSCGLSHFSVLTRSGPRPD